MCSACNTRKAEQQFSAATWKRARNGGRVCLDCSGKAWGWWRCSVCNIKQPACAFEAWLAQHRSCSGDQVCSNCWKCPIPRGSISKAVQRVAATQAKMAVRAADEKKARAIADVWAAIAERKCKREQERLQTEEETPQANQRRQNNGRDMTIADVPEASAERKRKQDSGDAETQEAERRAKERKDGTEEGQVGQTDVQATEKESAKLSEASAERKRKQDSGDAETQEAERRGKERKDGTEERRVGQTDVQAKEKESAKLSENATVPAKERKATQKDKPYEYIIHLSAL